MVDFKKMAASQNPTLRIKPDEIFDRLPKPQSFDDLLAARPRYLMHGLVTEIRKTLLSS
ncbi:MAG: hypothetical protein UFF97_08400 [Collinsella sp.]|nr:hypothetical protein [Collinsella sp.]